MDKYVKISVKDEAPPIGLEEVFVFDSKNRICGGTLSMFEKNNQKYYYIDLGYYNFDDIQFWLKPIK